MNFLGEKLWHRIKKEINAYYYRKHLKANFVEAEKMRPKIVQFLELKRIRYIIQIRKGYEPEWPNVVIDVQVDMKSFKKILDLWAEIDKVAYLPSYSGDVYIHVDQLV